MSQTISPFVGAGISSHTFSHEVSGGRGKLLIVTVGWANETSKVVDSVTFDGTSLTLAASAFYSNESRVEHWYLVNPPSKTANVVVTFSGVVDDEGGFVAAVNFQEVDQDNPIGNTASNTGNTNTPNVSISGSIPSLIYDSYFVDCEDRTGIGFGQTELFHEVQGGDGGSFCGSTKKGVNGITTMSWEITDTTSDRWAIAAIEIKPRETLFITEVKDGMTMESMKMYIDYDLNTLAIKRIWQDGAFTTRIIKVALEDTTIPLVKNYTVNTEEELDEDLSSFGFEIEVTDCEIELKNGFNAEVRTKYDS